MNDYNRLSKIQISLLLYYNNKIYCKIENILIITRAVHHQKRLLTHIGTRSLFLYFSPSSSSLYHLPHLLPSFLASYFPSFLSYLLNTLFLPLFLFHPLQHFLPSSLPQYRTLRRDAEGLNEELEISSLDPKEAHSKFVARVNSFKQVRISRVLFHNTIKIIDLLIS